MINFPALEEILKLALFSAYLEGERPLSILIIAPIESGKTEFLLRLNGTKSVKVLNDLTAYGAKNLLIDIYDGNYSHVIIPDLTKLTSRSRDAVDNVISILNSLIEEGIVEIQTAYMRKKFDVPVNCGLITAITTEAYLENWRRWKNIGFLSRCLPITYRYSDTTQEKIRDQIARLEHTFCPLSLRFPSEKKRIRMPWDIGRAIKEYSKKTIEPQIKAKEMTGFRMQRHLQRLAMARALAQDREAVDWSDYHKIKEYSKYINLNYNEV